MGAQTLLSYVRLLFMMMMVLLSCLIPYSLSSYNDDEDIDGHNLASRRQLMSSSVVISVTDYGAKGNGKSDDTKAFEQAWKTACSRKNDVVLVVPGNKMFLLGPITFSGPCKSSVTMKVHGTILASIDRSDYEKDTRHWILFDSINNFHLLGGGTFNGRGSIWWKNSCKIDKSKHCKIAPTAVTFSECTNLRVETLVFRNAQQMTVSFEKCIGVSGSSLVINSPGWSPNTDGIHIADSQNVQLSKCSIKTGDDCISIESGSQHIRASDIVCGPGHGISIGSLGDDNSHAIVSDVSISRVKLIGTTNGVRIKTWQGGSGYARGIKFEDITMNNVINPIIIDQNYCDKDGPCKEQSNAVQVENVLYRNIRGTSASKKAINIDCSEKYLCKGIVMHNINLRTADGDDVNGVCQNAQVKSRGIVSPSC
ncbi:unnamed protein product [Rhodiola kirilowii]